jgi:hypothetical protein
MFNLAVNVAQPPPPAYQLPPIDYKDEISYIARTGNVSGSAAATRPIIRGTSSQKYREGVMWYEPQASIEQPGSTPTMLHRCQ